MVDLLGVHEGDGRPSPVPRRSHRTRRPDHTNDRRIRRLVDEQVVR